MIDKETKDLLTCPKCNQLSKNPLECLGCHQIYCTDHKPPICFTCKSKTDFKSSLIAKKIISEMEINCEFCLVSLKMINLDSHLLECDKQLVKCKYEQCQFKSNKNEFLEHIMLVHDKEIVDFFSNQPNVNVSKLRHILPINKFDERILKKTTENEGKPQQSQVKNKTFTFNNKQFQVTETLWINMNKRFIYTKSGKYILSNIHLFSEGVFNIKFKSIDYNFIIVGFSTKQYNGEVKFLGGESGVGDWGLAGNGNIGCEGKWDKSNNSILKFKDNKITLIFNNGLISVMIDNKPNSYSYRLSSKTAFLSVCLFHTNDECLLLD